MGGSQTTLRGHHALPTRSLRTSVWLDPASVSLADVCALLSLLPCHRHCHEARKTWVFQVPPLALASTTPNQNPILASQAAAFKAKGYMLCSSSAAQLPQSLPGHPLWVKDLFMHTLGAPRGTVPDTEQGLNQVLRMQGTTWLMLL